MSTERTRGNATRCRLPMIATHATPEMKRAFAALAASRGMKESSLLRVAIDTVLERNAVPAVAEAEVHEGKRACVHMRLFPRDLARISDRAAARHMKATTYVAALVHGHVRREPPLPTPELNALKTAVGHLSALSRQLQSLGPSAVVSDGDLGSRLREAVARVEAVRHHVADLVRVNVRSWATDDV